MGKMVVFMALCVLLPALVCATRPMANPLIVSGKVYCDTCRAGFETPLTTYMKSAKVKIECRDRHTLELLYRKEGKTDSTGTYRISVSEDHADQICDAMLVESSEKNCQTASQGRDGAQVILTSSNGIASNQRYANAMGFMKDEPLSECAQVLKQYQEFDE